jgi:hypothetical protein
MLSFRRPSLSASMPVSCALAFAIALVAPSAFADEPVPAPSVPVQVTPAPGQAAASAPSPAAVPITATCALGDHPGVDEAEARTGADVICHDLAKEGATNTAHEVRFGKLGGKLLVTVASRNGNAYDERRALLTSMDELPVAGPRLAGALSNGRPLEETKTVDNVLNSETRAPKTERGQMGFDMGLFGMTGAHSDAGAAGGIHMGLVYRAGNLGITSHGRAGGIGSGDDKIVTASIDVGARYYFSNGETAAFLGGGIGLAYFNMVNSDKERSGSGIAPFAEVGVDMLRTHHTALTASFRADAPLFSLNSTYLVPLSLNVGVMFH